MLVVVQMYDGLDVVIVVDQADVSPDGDVAMASGRRRQLARQFGRCGVYLSASFAVKHGALVQICFPVGWESVSIPKANWGIVFVLVVVVFGYLLVVVVKMARRTTPAILGNCKSG